MGSLRGVVGVGAVAGVDDGAEALFFKGVVGEGLAEGVLAEPDLGGFAVLEADHVVFPVLEVFVSFWL